MNVGHLGKTKRTQITFLSMNKPVNMDITEFA
jgi:hypothetical protein